MAYGGAFFLWAASLRRNIDWNFFYGVAPAAICSEHYTEVNWNCFNSSASCDVYQRSDCSSFCSLTTYSPACPGSQTCVPYTSGYHCV